MLKHYILKDKKVVECSLDEWAKFFENFKNRILYQDVVNNKLISTVFLGLDHSFKYDNCNNPLLFETMVFTLGKWSEEYCERYSNYDEALKRHKEIIKSIENNTFELENE